MMKMSKTFALFTLELGLLCFCMYGIWMVVNFLGAILNPTLVR